MLYIIFFTADIKKNYLINKFELELFQDFHYNLKQKSKSRLIYYLYYQKNVAKFEQDRFKLDLLF